MVRGGGRRRRIRGMRGEMRKKVEGKPRGYEEERRKGNMEWRGTHTRNS